MLIKNIKYYSEMYTNYWYPGTSRIQLPYYWGGKLTYNEIDANLYNLGAPGKTTEQVQTICNNNKSLTGIDCSGFVVAVLQDATSTSFLTSIAPYAFATSYPRYADATTQRKYGISASILTNTSTSSIINSINDMQPGDFIRWDNGSHIGIILDIQQTEPNAGRVIYAHSSGSIGPHTGYVDVSDGNLKNGTWIDNGSATTGSTFKNLFNYVCRPLCCSGANWN